MVFVALEPEDRSAIQKELSAAVAIARQIAAAAKMQQQRIDGGGQTRLIAVPVVESDSAIEDSVATSRVVAYSSLPCQSSVYDVSVPPTDAGQTIGIAVASPVNGIAHRGVIGEKLVATSLVALSSSPAVDVDPLLSGPVTVDNIAYRLQHESYCEGTLDGRGMK
jgi:hypothetical protein